MKRQQFAWVKSKSSFSWHCVKLLHFSTRTDVRLICPSLRRSDKPILFNKESVPPILGAWPIAHDHCLNALHCKLQCEHSGLFLMENDLAQGQAYKCLQGHPSLFASSTNWSTPNWSTLSDGQSLLRIVVIKKLTIPEVMNTSPCQLTNSVDVCHRYDFNGKGYIDHQHFLHMMGKSFAPGDDAGVSRRIVEDSYEALENHHLNQMGKQ